MQHGYHRGEEFCCVSPQTFRILRWGSHLVTNKGGWTLYLGWLSTFNHGSLFPQPFIRNHVTAGQVPCTGTVPGTGTIQRAMCVQRSHVQRTYPVVTGVRKVSLIVVER